MIEGLVPADQLLQAAHRCHATLTVFLTAVLMQAIEGLCAYGIKKAGDHYGPGQPAQFF